MRKGSATNAFENAGDKLIQALNKALDGYHFRDRKTDKNFNASVDAVDTMLNNNRITEYLVSDEKRGQTELQSLIQRLDSMHNELQSRNLSPMIKRDLTQKFDNIKRPINEMMSRLNYRQETLSENYNPIELKDVRKLQNTNQMNPLDMNRIRNLFNENLNSSSGAIQTRISEVD